MSRIVSIFLFLILSSVLGLPVQAATSQGTRITNQAEASYFDTETGTVINVLSNYATLVVGRYLAHEQTEETTQPAVGGQPVYFPHTIANTGNVADKYNLLVENLSSDNGDLGDLRIFLDQNGDGQVNLGEPEISLTELLQPGESIRVVIVGTVPTNAVQGDQYAVKLSSTSNLDPSVTKEGVNNVTIISGALIRITHKTDTDCTIPLDKGKKVSHEVAFTNLGNEPPIERSITVNGIAMSGVLFETSLSAYVNLAQGSEFFAVPVQAMPVLALQGGAWISHDQWDGSSKVEKVGILLPASTLKPNQSGKFGFTLQVIKQPEQQTTVQIQTVLDANGDGTPDFQSANNCNTLIPDDEIPQNLPGTISGTVFDSANLERIPDAEVLLVDAATHATVASTRTDANGRYTFTAIAAGKYYLKVNPPSTYVMPSVNPPGNFPGRDVVNPSYGLHGYAATPAESTGSAGVFVLDTGENAGMSIDIPLDQKGITGQLAIEKTVSKTTAAIGDLLSYTIKVRNLSEQDLYAAYIKDQLPYGFKYLSGTTKLNGEVAQDPSLTLESAPKGTSLAFRLGQFPANAEWTLTYITQVTALGVGSEGINTAFSTGSTLTGLPIQSPLVKAQVSIKQEGVLSERAILFGRIAVEAGCKIGDAKQALDQQRQASGWPLADVRLYMEDGTYVVTDPDGQFSLYGLKPGLHVLKVDPHTLPEGVVLKVVDHAQAGDPDSRFVDLMPGEFQRADFTAQCPEAKPKTVEKCTEQPVAGVAREWTTRTLPNVIPPLHFDSGKAHIPPEYLEKLRQLLVLSKDKHNARFGFVGHTDNQRLKPETKAKFKDNPGLSQARAHEAAEYVLKNLGVQTEISVDGKGENQPVASNDTPEGMAKNRRVEINLIYEEPVEKHAQASTKTVCASEIAAEQNAVAERIIARSRSSEQGWHNEIDNLDPSNVNSLRHLANQAEAAQNGDISNGLMEAYQRKAKEHQQSFAASKAEEAEQAAEAAVPVPKEAVRAITHVQAKSGTWLWPLGDTSIDGRFMLVTPADITPTLYINGKAVDASHLGEQIVNKKEQAQVMAWYGVELDEGENQVKIAVKDNFGNERTIAEKTFKRPSAGVAVKMTVENTLTADRGRSAVPVKIQIVDKNGYPAKGTYFLTLESSEGEWLEADIQDKVPGHQVKVTNGERIVHLRSGSQTGQVKLRASTGTLQSEVDVAQVAEMRPLVAVGLLDIRAHQGYGKGGYDSVVLQQVAESDGVEVDGRAALFMKGRVKGDMHLTLSYDNQKDADAELLRDIDPEAYYQVYGDSSIRGYEAQSRSQLYAKLEKDRHSVMWGDYVTDNNSSPADIAKVQRTLTGANAVYDDGKTRVQAFAASQDNPRASEELPGNGTALFHKLQGVPVVRNSEIVEIITRDRANSGLLVKVEKLERFRDYSIDEVTGNITFHRVIPSLDENLNPVSVRISYDKEVATEDYLVAGIRADHKVTDALSVGVSHTRDEHSTDGYQVSGVHAEYKDQQTTVQAGIAQMEHNDSDPEGKAVRVQATHQWDAGSRTELVAAQADAGFTNSSSGVQADRREIKLTHEQKVSKDTTAKVELVDSQALSTDASRRSAELSATTKVDDWKLKAGTRRIEQTDGTSTDTVNTLLIGAERPVEILGKKGSIKAEHEREIGDGARQRTAVGADMQVGDKTKAYVRMENADRLAGGTLAGTVDTQNTLVAGVKTEVLPSTELYSEYRIEGDINGEDVVTANGAKANLEVEDNLTVTPTVEFLNYQEGSTKEDSIAASVAIQDTRDKTAKKLLRVETRQSDNETYYGANGAYVTRAGEDLTVMVGDEVRYQQNKTTGEDQLNNTLTLAAAHRPKDGGPYNALYAYKWKKDDAKDEDTHLLSTHQHYRLNDETDVSGHVGAKFQQLQAGSSSRDSEALLAAAHVQTDISERVGLNGQVGLLGSGDTTRYTAGAGVHVNLVENLRLGAGYNIAGFDDNDLDPQGRYANGAYLGLQMKADEALFSWLQDDKDKNCKPLTMVEREQLYSENKPLPEGCDDNNNNNTNKGSEHETAASGKP